MLYNLSNKNKILIGLILFVLLAFLIYWLYGLGINDNVALKEENQKIKDSISQIKFENKTLLIEIDQRDKEAYQLLFKLEENQKNYNLVKYRYEKIKKDFQALSSIDRDSIIREYIRSNQ